MRRVLTRTGNRPAVADRGIPEVHDWLVPLDVRFTSSPVQPSDSLGGEMGRTTTALALMLVGMAQATPLKFPPGYVDPAPILAAASEAIGEGSLRCITFSGSGYGGAVGQTFENAMNVDWPRIDALANYTRTIDWDARTSKETFERQPGLNPASWKYGLGWQGGTPTQRAVRQTHMVNGRFAWHRDGDGAPVPVPPELAEAYQLDLWLNPPGFLKATRLPGANPVAFWRWEQIEKGRDGNVVAPEKVHVVAITVLGKYRVDATIDSRHRITRIKTTVNEPALGDFNIEHESTDERMFGNVKWPVSWHSHQGWDDNWQFYRQSTGHNAYGGTFADVRPNVCGDPVPVPSSVMQATFPEAVTVDRMAPGVYRLGGGPANSYMVEFADFVAVFEAPGNEDRSLAVIESVVKLAPNKPIRWLISSHPHFDHIGGLRTYLHIGATIVTHMKNLAFLNRDVLNYEPRTVAPDIVSRWPPTELSEGYNYEAVQENYVITDNSRILRVYYVQPLQHAEGMLMAYLPAERIAFQADLFDTHEPPRPQQLPAMRSLDAQVRRMKLDVATLAPVHGTPVPWSVFRAALESLTGGGQ
ncbi:MAG TPA: MBL fold metallo-hydrolase [Vicinamibacterales bacterium]|nr:MBL fold metallo-hydrolase [Vicinamibacterales bacterium]